MPGVENATHRIDFSVIVPLYEIDLTAFLMNYKMNSIQFNKQFGLCLFQYIFLCNNKNFGTIKYFFAVMLVDILLRHTHTMRNCFWNKYFLGIDKHTPENYIEK